MKIILLNGPASSGKDTIGLALADVLHTKGIQSNLQKLAYPIKRAIAAAWDMTEAQYQHFFESPAKNEETDFFLGKTPRQVLIDFSEIFIKPRVSQDTFAELLCRRSDAYPKDSVLIVTDCGFEVEAQYLSRQYGERNVVVLRLHRQDANGNPLTFKNDSRNYVEGKFFDCAGILDVHNNSTPEGVAEDIISNLSIWLGITKDIPLEPNKD